MNKLCETQKGFTLIELVMVIVLLGILSLGARSLFSTKSGYTEFIAKEQFIAQGLLAQQIAFGMSAVNNPVSLSIIQSASGQTSFHLTKSGEAPLIETLDASLSSLYVDGVIMSNGSSITFTWNSQAGLTDNANHAVSFVGDETYRVCLSSSGYVYESSVSCP